MKPLHTSTWRTESDCGVLVDVAEGRTTEWVPFREIVVTTDAGMSPAEARRLVADLQHAIALAEEDDARPDCQDCDCLQWTWNGRSHLLRSDPPSACVCGHETVRHHSEGLPVSEDQPKPRESVTYEQYAEAIRAAAKAQTTSHQRHGMAHQPKTIYVGDMVKAAFDAAGIKVASVDLTALSELLADSEQVTR